ncbi:MAG: hypothetical protein ACTSR4_02735 [Candidatus Hodarchaeales archaeon]
MKLLTVGCSFTKEVKHRNFSTWKNWVVEKFPEFDYISLESLASPNCTNVPEITEKIRELDDGEKAIAIIQLTGMDRMYVEGLGRSPAVASIEHHMKKKKRWCSWGMIAGKGGHEHEAYSNRWLDYFINEYDEEAHINTLIKNLVEFQKVCEQKKIPNLVFLGWNIFVQQGKSKMWDLKKPYENIEDPLVFELYESSQKLVEALDFSKFYFFENDKVKYGGLTEFSQHILPSEKWFRKTTKPIDFHPSDAAHEEFANKVILPWIRENL